jgi:predicted ABC-type ATPase
VGRIRIFAGPNGSGKTTLNSELKGQYNLGYYINADDLFQKVKEEHTFDFSVYNLTPPLASVKAFASRHGLFPKLPFGLSFVLHGSQAIFSGPPNVYEMAIITDYLRHSLLELGETFTFETVFSHPAKISFINKANKKGYRTYLYFVSTNSPEINIERVKQRVKEGGHAVPEAKIRSRYKRSLENLLPAMKQAYRTYVFDNSGKSCKLLAQVTPGKNLTIDCEHIPLWFEEYVLKHILD